MKKRLRITYNAPVILTYVIICFIVTAAGVITQGKSTELFFMVYRSSPKNPLSYIRLFTHVFGHINFSHFIGNSMYLLLLGPMLEEKYGSAALIRIFILTAFATGIIHCILSGDSALCGASGIVFTCIILSSFTAFADREIPLTFILVFVLFVGQEIYSGLTIVDNISNLTHIIGGLIGSISGFIFNKNKLKT